jgi:molecular chaperone DnaK (HSP70)
MLTDEIVILTKQKIPTIVGYDVRLKKSTIGEEARLTGLNGKTTVFNFKPAFGDGDKDFSKEKNYWYYVLSEGREHIETFTAKEASLRYLRTLFSTIQMPEKIIVGVPGIREQSWQENFRRHMREVFSELGMGQPEFFPEPFAVFQYYRHVAKAFPVERKAEVVLIIDVGGGTECVNNFETRW